MKIVQVCPYNILRPGGVQRHILSLADALRARGHGAAVIAPGPGPSQDPHRIFVGGQREIGFSGTRFELTWASREDLSRLREWLAQWRPDILHFHTLWSPAMPFQVFRAWDGPTVVTFHDTPPTGAGGAILRALFRAMGRRIMPRIDGAIAVSRSPAGHLDGTTGPGLEIIPPAVALGPMTGARRPRGAGEPFRFLFVGRLEPRKGIAELLRAWEEAQPSFPTDRPAALTIAGRGEFASQVRALQERLGAASVTFLEGPDDAALRDLYASADVFVAPSPFGESFGIVLTEAMANGLPVIAAGNAGYSTVLTGPGRDGLVPAGDVHALATAMLRFHADAGLRERLSTWSLARAPDYDIAAIAPLIEAVYHNALAAHARRASPAA